MLIAAATACADEAADAGGRNVFMYRRSLIRSAAAAGLLPGAAPAQSFPSKPLRLLVGAAAGGGADIVARILAQELTKGGGLSNLVDNKPGAGGTVATREMLRAPADGHTILVANVGVLAVIPYATKDPGYDRAPTSRRSVWRSILPTCWSSIPACRPGRSPSISRWPGGRTAWTTARRASAAPAISPASS